MCISHFPLFSVFLDIFHILQCVLPFFDDFQCSMRTTGPTVCFSHFPVFSVFLDIFHVKAGFCLIFHVFFSFLAIFQVLQCTILIFYIFECFLPYSRSKSVCVSFSTFFQFSCHILRPAMCIYHFFRFFSVSHRLPGHRVFVPHLPRLSVFSP